MRLTSLFSTLLLVVTLTGCGKDDKPTTGGPVAGPNTQQPQPSDPKPQPKPPENTDPKPKLPENADPKPPTNPGDDLTKVKPDVTMTAKEWATQHFHGRVIADADVYAKYSGKVIELSGVVKEVGQFKQVFSDASVYYVDLKVEEGKVRCEMHGDPAFWEKISKGSEVSIRGKASSGTVAWLATAVVVKAGPNPSPTVAATELTKEFKADSAAAEKKYGVGIGLGSDKDVYVTGEVLVVTKEGEKDVTIAIKGEGDAKVICNILPLAGARPQETALALKPGQKIKVLGDMMNPKKGDPVLRVTLLKGL